MRRFHQPVGGAARLAAASLCLVVATSCIATWSDLPKAPRAASGAAASDTLYYEIGAAKGLFGGGDALREAFRKHAPFAHVEPISEPPGRGLFCRVEMQRRSPSVASGVLAYVSYAFFMAIPVWSSEGYTLRYHVYLDGEERKIFEYDITRKTFAWIVVLPVTWVNWLTPSEKDAFEATVHRFFADVTPYVRGDRAWPRPGAR
jgi:hypothetical protein